MPQSIVFIFPIQLSITVLNQTMEQIDSVDDN